MTDFLEQLNIIDDFDQVTDDSLYKKIPDDWLVIITDVIGSTRALEAGKYKEVNTLGAITVALIQNILGTLDFAFVFGGDGATITLPGSDYDKVYPHLSGLNEIAINRFGLELRVCTVSVKELFEKNGIIKMAKLRLHKQRTITVFSGGGLKLADALIKRYPEKYGLKISNLYSSPNLNNLSCRWNPIPAQHGQILTILIESDVIHIYSDILTKIKAICNDDFNSVVPVLLIT
jgi:hypothetical protein